MWKTNNIPCQKMWRLDTSTCNRNIFCPLAERFGAPAQDPMSGGTSLRVTPDPPLSCPWLAISSGSGTDIWTMSWWIWPQERSEFLSWKNTFPPLSLSDLIWTYFIVYIHIQKVWTQVLTTYEVLTLTSLSLSLSLSLSRHLTNNDTVRVISEPIAFRVAVMMYFDFFLLLRVKLI